MAIATTELASANLGSPETFALSLHAHLPVLEMDSVWSQAQKWAVFVMRDTMVLTVQKDLVQTDAVAMVHV